MSYNIHRHNTKIERIQFITSSPLVLLQKILVELIAVGNRGIRHHWRLEGNLKPFIVFHHNTVTVLKITTLHQHGTIAKSKMLL
jgi:hypothetical protein